MDMQLTHVRTRGRAPRRIGAEVVRELTVHDIELINAGGQGQVKQKPLQRLRDRHHAVAKFIAAGRTYREAAVICGYVPERVTSLMTDPTFRNLVRFYREQEDREYVNAMEQLSGLNRDLILLMRERVEDEPEKLKTDTLLEAIKITADRTGMGPTSTSQQNVNVNVNLADRLQQARKRIAERTLDLTPVEDV
jgi:hypothetical protein